MRNPDKKNILRFLLSISFCAVLSFSCSCPKTKISSLEDNSFQTLKTSFSENSYNYTVPGKIPILKQENRLACWATVITMLVSWKEQKEYSVEAVLEKAGDDYLDLFFDKKGLDSCGKRSCPAPSKEDLIKKFGMEGEGPQSFTESGWLALLKEHGPLWITSQLNREDEKLAKFSTHARILFGMSRDDKNIVIMRIIDPETGTSYEENFEDFFRRYENLAKDELDILRRQTNEKGEKDLNITFQPQVIHF